MLSIYTNSFLRYFKFDRFIQFCHFYRILSTLFGSFYYFLIFKFNFLFSFWFLLVIFDNFCIFYFLVVYGFVIFFRFYNSLKWSTPHMKVSRDLLGKVEVQISFFLEIWTSPSGSSIFVIIAQYSSALTLLIITWYVLLGLTGNPLSTALLIPLGGSLM